MRKLTFLMIVGLVLMNSCSNKMRVNKSASSTASGSTAASSQSPSNQTQATPKSLANLKPPRRGEVLFLGNVGQYHAGRYV